MKLYLAGRALLFALFALLDLLAFSPSAFSQDNGSALMGMERTIGLGREEYRYVVSWGPMQVGKSSLGSLSKVNIASTTAYHLFTEARTMPFFDMFYKVRDKNDAWLDAGTFVSVGFSKNLREGKFRRHEELFYNHAKGEYKAKIFHKDGSVTQEGGLMKPYAYDVLSALYWVRAQNLKVGHTLSINVNTRKDWPLLVKVLRREKAKVPAGEFDCLVIEPKLADEGIFIQKGQSMTIWLTNDSRKIPVMLKAEVFIGSVKAELEEIVYKE